MKGNGLISLKVYDSQGRLRMTLKDGWVSPGRYAALVSGLSPGTYTVSLVTGGIHISRNLLMAR